MSAAGNMREDRRGNTIRNTRRKRLFACALPTGGLVASVCERNLKQNRGSVNLPLKMCGQCEIFGVTDWVCD